MAVFYRRKTLKNELVIVLDFGGQYNQLVARRVRECNVYCEIYSYRTDIEKIKEMNPKESSLQEVRTAAICRIHRLIQMSCSSWEFRCWGSVTAHSL